MKMSELLRGALADLRVLRATPGYVVDMGLWCRNEGDVCAICLAGAHLHRTLGVPKPEGGHGWTINSWVAKECGNRYTRYDAEHLPIAEALDALRNGDVYRAARVLGLWCPPNMYEVKVTDYDRDAEAWFVDMDALVEQLEESNA